MIKTIRQPKTQLTVLISGILIILSVLLLSELSGNTVLGSKDYEVNYVTVLISENDTLWDLSLEFNNTNHYSNTEFIQEIISINGLSSEKIYAGERLTIPIITDNYN